MIFEMRVTERERMTLYLDNDKQKPVGFNDFMVLMILMVIQ